MFNLLALVRRHSLYILLKSSQGAMFLVNSCQGYFSCGPRTQYVRGQGLSRTYARFFAEFLRDVSLVRLGLLALTTCVGLRYRPACLNLRGFSWKCAPASSPVRTLDSSRCSEYWYPDLPGYPPHNANANPITRRRYSTPSPHRKQAGSRNIDRVSIGSPVRDCLRP